MKLSKKLIENKKNIERNAFLWNMSASMLNAGMSALLLMAVVRIAGEEQKSIFVLAFSIAQQMLAIGLFDVRPYQVTDIHKKIEFEYYHTFRVITCLAMLAAGMLQVVLSGYSFYKGSVVILFCLLKMLDAYEDVLHGLFQQEGRLDIAGKLQTIRIVIGIVCYVAALSITGDVAIACIITIIISAIVIIVLNIPIMPYFHSFSFGFSYEKIKKLFIACFPLFVGSYLVIYMGNAPKYAIDKFLEPEAQTIFTTLFMPSFVINLLSSFIFRPAMTPMALSWSSNDRKRYNKILRSLLGWVLILTVGALAGTYLLGIPLLSVVYPNVTLSPYRYELMVLMLAGGLGAAGTVLYYAMTIIRYQKYFMISYVVTGAAAYFLSPIMVKEMGFTGAAYAYLILIFLRVVSFAVIYSVCYKRSEIKQKV